MQCNIDARGKAVRLINGIVGLIAGFVLLFTWPMRTGSATAWIVTMVLLLFGAFSVFEGWAGWCVVRAMGFKTRL